MPIVSSKALERALSKRVIKEKEKFTLEKYLFKEQLDFVLDEDSAKIAVCSRRAGKSVACAADLVYTALSQPEISCLYITLTRRMAKQLVWKEIKIIDRKYNLGGDYNSSDLTVTFPNGSMIYLSGANTSDEIEKFRGSAFKKVYIDEGQSFGSHIEELINDVLGPSLMDYAGSLILIGTPPPIPTGFFSKTYQESKGWSKHHWTFWDNPFIIEKSGLTHQQMIDKELKRRGIAADSPSVRREWYGEFTLDADSLLLHYDKTHNHFEKLPDNKSYSYVMGVDLGFNDADAIAVLAWSDNSPVTYLVEELVVSQQGITPLVAQIEAFQKKYPISRIVVDQGALGKKIAEELTRRHAIPVEAAEKQRKMENVAFLNDALRTGKFMANKESKFANDSYLVEIDQERSTADKIMVSKKYHSDIIDAVLYAFKLSPAYAFQAQKPKPKPGTDQWAKEEHERMIEAAYEHFKKQDENEGF